MRLKCTFPAFDRRWKHPGSAFVRFADSGICGKTRPSDQCQHQRSRESRPNLPQYSHREYTISISTTNVGGRVKVHTAISSRLATPHGADNGMRAATTRFVAAGSLDLILRDE